MSLSRLTAFFFLAFLAQSTFAEVVSTEATGYGPDEEMAVNKALQTAVTQVSGVEIKTVDTFGSRSSGSQTDTNGETVSNRVVEFDKSTASELKVAGLVDSYEVLDLQQVGGLWKATVRAGINKYELDKSASRKKLAMLPLEFRNNVTNAQGLMIHSAIEAKLVQARKFAVLTRFNIDKVLQEQKFISGENIRKEERAKLGNLLGADVILSLIVNGIEFSERTETIRITGNSKKVATGRISVEIRVISAVTGEIKYSDTYLIESDTKQDTLENLIDRLAVTVTNDLVRKIYPIRVVNVSSSGAVFLSHGGDGISVGDNFAVYDEGERLVDPYTGESLGAEEIEVARLKITRVQSKFSVAEVLSGQGLREGMVVREVEAEAPVETPIIKRDPPPAFFRLPGY